MPSYSPEHFARVKGVDAAQEQFWSEFRSLFSQNESLIDDESTSTGGDARAHKLKGILVTFMKDVDAVLEELSFLGKIHPYADVAITGFHKVIKLDLTRRENDKKILVMAVEMQGMMSPVLQLRFLKRENIPKEAGDEHEERLKRIMTQIAESINKCRSDIEEYHKRKKVVKFLQANVFENKFAEHMKTFSFRRTELQTVISGYVAIGMSSANDSLARVEKKLDAQFDIITNIFRKLDTQTEISFFRFVRDNGGETACVNDDHLLPKLLKAAGEDIKPGDLYNLKIKEELQNALRENLNEVLDKNYLRFEKMIQVENNNIRNTLIRLSAHLDLQHDLEYDNKLKLDKIEETVTMMLRLGKMESVTDKIEDPEFHRVWTKMQVLGNAVKAKRFVLTLRDHITSDNSQITTGTDNVDVQISSETASGFATEATDSDNWVLEYIDVAYLRPIVEAMDEDASGFISVREANSFALARPPGLSLLNWIAYWGAGWHINLDWFRWGVYGTLLEMHKTLPEIHVANRAYVDDYLDNYSLRQIEALISSIKPLPISFEKPSKLRKIAEDVAAAQSKILEDNLSVAKYVIETDEDVVAIIQGSTRVEAWILPLLFLLLNRHLQIIQLAKYIVMDEDEFAIHIQSLRCVVAVFNERVKNLEAKFTPLYGDINAQFRTFSYGMFSAAFEKKDLINTALILNSLYMSDSLRDYQEEERAVLGKEKLLALSDSILARRPVGTVFGDELEDLNLPPPEPAPIDHIPHPLEGLWYGRCSGTADAKAYSYCFEVHPICGNTFQAKGQGYFGLLNITGEFNIAMPFSEGRINVRMDLGDQIHTGIYDPRRDTIEGGYVSKEDETTHSEAEDVVDGPKLRPEPNLNGEVEAPPGSGDDENHGTEQLEDSPDGTVSAEQSTGRFFLTRKPPGILELHNRFLLDASYHPPVDYNYSETARKRWIFATESVLFLYRAKFGKKFKDMLAYRRKWLRFRICTRLDSEGLQKDGYESLVSERELLQFQDMLSETHPKTASFYDATADYMKRRRMYDVGNIECDGCGRQIIFSRHHCIVCVLDTSYNQVDLCENCCDMPEAYSKAGFHHVFSHTLVRSRSRIHAFEAKTLNAVASNLSELCKKTFRSLEKKRAATKGRGFGKGAVVGAATGLALEKDVKTQKSTPMAKGAQPCCKDCGKEITLPCWVCLECFTIRYSCDACDEMSDHSRAHLSLRIHNSIKSKLEVGKDIERQLNNIKSTVVSQLRRVEKRVNDIALMVREAPVGAHNSDDDAKENDTEKGDTEDSDAEEDDSHADLSDDDSSGDRLSNEGEADEGDAGHQNERMEKKGNDDTVIGDSYTNLMPTPESVPSANKALVQAEVIVSSEQPQINISTRLSTLEEKFEKMNQTLEGLENKIDEVLSALVHNHRPPHD